MTTRVFQLAAAEYSAGRRQTPHTHDELQITVVLRGTLEERVAGSPEHASPLSLVVKDPGVIHEDQFGRSGALTARLALHNTTLADLVEHPGRAAPWRWIHDAHIAHPFLRIVARGLQGERRFADDDDDLVDLLAAISARSQPPASGEPRWLRDAVRQMRDDWQPGLTVRDVARAADVHPVYLARCVRRWHGIGAGEILRQSRLRHAARAIADGDPTIATVAYASGFADESHLCREFASAAGMPPARYRRLARAFAGFADSSFHAPLPLSSTHDPSSDPQR
jgi:AraC family transcriptional regulator